MFNGFFTIALVLLVGFAGYKIYSLKMSLRQLLLEHAETSFQFLNVYSTISEIIGLAIIAIESPSRHISEFNAISRYAFVGILELIVSFLFTYFFIDLIEYWAKKGRTDWYYQILSFIICSPLWICGALITNLISLLYLESIGHRELVISDGFMPWHYAAFQTVPVELMDPYVQPELGAMILIFITPIMSLFLILFYVMRINKSGELLVIANEEATRLAAEQKKKDEASKKKDDDKKTEDKKDKTEDGKKPEDPKKSEDKKPEDGKKPEDPKKDNPSVIKLPDNFQPFTEALAVLAELTSTDTFNLDNFRRFLYQLCGMDPDANVMKVYEGVTNDSVKKYVSSVLSNPELGTHEGTSPAAYMKSVISRLMGNHGTTGDDNKLGLSGIIRYNRDLDNKMVDLGAVSEEAAAKFETLRRSRMFGSASQAGDGIKMQAMKEVDKIASAEDKAKATKLVDEVAQIAKSLSLEVHAITQTTIVNMRYNKDTKY